VLVLEKTDRGTTAVPVHVLIYGNYSAAENYRNITLRAVMIGCGSISHGLLIAT
jgi:hypothetical protein